MDNKELLRHYRNSILMQLYLDTLNHQGTFIRRSLFNDVLYDENLMIVSDWKFWLDAIVQRNASVEVIDIIVVIQDMNGISSESNSQDNDTQKKEREIVLNDYFPLLVRKELDDYQMMCESPYVIYSESLKKSHLLHALGLRVLKLLTLFTS